MKLSKRVKQTSRSLDHRRQVLGRGWQEASWRPQPETLLRGGLVVAFALGFVARRWRPTLAAGVGGKAVGVLSRVGSGLSPVPVSSVRRR